MRTATTLISIILLALSARAQTKKSAPSPVIISKETPPIIGNQGEQENYWAEQLFKNQYEKQDFKRFGGKILIDGNVFRFDNEVLKIGNIGSLRLIFEKGIFYPGIKSEDQKADELRKSQKSDSSEPGLKEINASLVKDSFRITDLEELRFLGRSPQVKRFRFWLFTEGFANPVVYFIELTNPKATEKTDMENFINGSVLTFYKQGWVII